MSAIKPAEKSESSGMRILDDDTHMATAAKSKGGGGGGGEGGQNEIVGRETL